MTTYDAEDPDTAFPPIEPLPPPDGAPNVVIILRTSPGAHPDPYGNSQLFFPGMGRLSENSVVSIKNKSFSVTTDVDVPAARAEGVIIAQGGRFGGWCSIGLTTAASGRSSTHPSRAA